MKTMKSLILCLVLLCGAAVLLAQTPQWQWATAAVGTDEAWNYGRSIAVDNQGNQYVAGRLEGTASFGSHTLTASGDEHDVNTFVAKLSPNGNWLWAVKVGIQYYDAECGIAIDSVGNAYVTGSFRDTATFGSLTLTASGDSGDIDMFVAKLDPDGNWLWAVKAGGPDLDGGISIALDSASNVYVTGKFRDTASFGSHTLTASGGEDDTDIFVAKLDPNGNWMWVVQAGGPDGDEGYGIALDSASNVYVTGKFRDIASFGSHTLTAHYYYDIFVGKLDTNGNWLWATKAGWLNTYGLVFSIALDSAGNAYVTGWFSGTATFGSHTLTASGMWDVFVGKLDAAGNWLWAVKAGGPDYDEGLGIALDSVDNVYVTGAFEGTASFGSHTLTASEHGIQGREEYDVFVAKLDPNGNWLWAVKAGGIGACDGGASIALDSASNIYVTGLFMDTATFGNHSLTAGGNADIFVAKLSSLVLEADFSADVLSGPEPLAVQFSDESTAGQHPITSWLWSFGDGGSSTQQNPLHTYTSPGVYTVILTVIDSAALSSTKVRQNYITVVDGICSIELLSPQSLDFGSVYLEDQSDWQEITFSNTGNVNLSFSEAHFLAEPLHFELSGNIAGLVLPPGETGSLSVRFAPHAAGALSDTLFIVNNSTNLPVIRVALSGTGLYDLYASPKAPANVQITMDGNNIVITWEAVTQNIHGQPITPDCYFIFNSPAPYGTYSFHGSASGLQYTHPMVGALQQKMFYRVVAYKHYSQRDFDLATLGLEPGMTEAEVMQRLKIDAE